MKSKILKILFLVFSLGLLIYVSFPSPQFPKPLPGSIQSFEPADVETSLRRSYFTNASRSEILKWYQSQFKGYLLNYPPEESQTLIRDQARSTYLQELVHPLRESLFINGFEPSLDKDVIRVEGVRYSQKVTVKYVPSSPLVRLLVAAMTLVSITALVREYRQAS